MAKKKTSRQWAKIWDDALVPKKPAARREILEAFLEAPVDEILGLAKRKRRLVSLPQLPLGRLNMSQTVRLFFAGGRKRHIFYDVAHLEVTRRRGGLRLQQLLIVPEMKVGLVPLSQLAGSYYLIHETVRAAAGEVGYHRVVNFTEYLTGSVEGPMFVPEVERDLPRLKEYNYRGSVIRCVWSTRGLNLRAAAKALEEDVDPESLRLRLKEIGKRIAIDVKMPDEVRRQIQPALNPVLQRVLKKTQAIHDQLKQPFHFSEDPHYWAVQFWCELNPFWMRPEDFPSPSYPLWP